MEPVRGQICAPALLRYHKMIDCMIRCAQRLRHQIHLTHSVPGMNLMWAGGCKCSTFWYIQSGHMHFLPAKHCRKLMYCMWMAM